MRKVLAMTFAMLIGFSVSAFGEDVAAGENMNIQETRIRILFGGEEAIVVLFDNPASRDFASLLPLAVTFADYAGMEKITWLPRALTVQSGVSGDHVQGDFAWYAPWGNLAVFYKEFGRDPGLYMLGRIESDKERLADMGAEFGARLEIVE